MTPRAKRFCFFAGIIVGVAACWLLFKNRGKWRLVGTERLTTTAIFVAAMTYHEDSLIVALRAEDDTAWAGHVQRDGRSEISLLDPDDREFRSASKTAVAVAHDKALFGDTLGRIWVVNILGGNVVTSWQAHDDTIHGLAVSADGRHLLSEVQTSLAVWNTEEWRHVSRIQDELFAHGATISDDGELIVAVTMNGVPCLFNSSTGTLRQRLESPDTNVGLARCAKLFKDDSRCVVGFQHGDIVVWDIASGEIVSQGKVGGSPVMEIAIRPRSSVAAVRCAVGSTPPISVWDLLPCARLATLMGPKGTDIGGYGAGPVAMVWGLDGNSILALYPDGALWTWAETR